MGKLLKFLLKLLNAPRIQSMQKDTNVFIVSIIQIFSLNFLKIEFIHRNRGLLLLMDKIYKFKKDFFFFSFLKVICL